MSPRLGRPLSGRGAGPSFHTNSCSDWSMRSAGEAPRVRFLGHLRVGEQLLHVLSALSSSVAGLSATGVVGEPRRSAFFCDSGGAR